MSLSEYFPIFDKLTPQEQEKLLNMSFKRTVPPGTVLHNGGVDCMGLLVIRS